MNEQPPVVPFDPLRFWLGDVPWSFLFELVVRLSVLYAILIVATRLMGRRLAGGLSRNELLAIVALASAMGPAVQDPERGLLPPLLVAGCVVVLQKTMARITVRSRRVESLLQGGTATLVCDGRLELGTLVHNGISRERLFAEVRSQGLTHLGQVRRAYLEPDGEFTFVKNEEAAPGLSVIPDWDGDFRAEQAASSTRICANCGARLGSAEASACPSCDSAVSTFAVN